MARLFLVPVDMNKNELRNAVIQNLGTAPSSPVEGQLYYDTAADRLKVWANGIWDDLNAPGGAGIPTTIVTAKGDLITATASNTPVRKAAGTNGFFLQSQSGQADGLLWAALVDADIPATLMRDAEHTTAIHQEILALADLTDWPRVAALDVNNQKITTVADPTADTDAANKRYVDGLIAGLSWKDSCRAATTGPITISTGLNSADVIDGVTLANGDRVLVKDQAAGGENGIYVVAASPARATDMDAAAEATNASVWVEEGTTNAESGWVMTTAPPITLGTTALAWVRFSGLGQITAGAGLTQTGNTIDAVAGTGIVVNANDIAVLRTDANGRTTIRYGQTFGDGAAVSYNIDHNLNSLDVVVAVYKVSTGAQVEPDVTLSTVNRVVLAFTVAPTSNEMRVVVQG